ncbi:MAG: hypothetical protein MUO85_04760 [candidate division Zixibacteria bacterium]|nr:hypothetical protein [candidate division Zixibacteria bacterium]
MKKKILILLVVVLALVFVAQIFTTVQARDNQNCKWVKHCPVDSVACHYHWVCCPLGDLLCDKNLK